jgi:thiamine-monophosphate kinase
VADEREPLSEFDLIDRYFTPRKSGAGARPDVILGVGDDAALLRIPEGADLVAAVDTLVAGRHFLAGCDPRSIGHRSLAVNLSDMAAMGATPAWATLALTLPSADAHWLEGFSTGLMSLAAAHGVELVGGDTTAGPLTVTIQILGHVARGTALRRDGAKAGDILAVTGAALGAGGASDAGGAAGDAGALVDAGAGADAGALGHVEALGDGRAGGAGARGDAGARAEIVAVGEAGALGDAGAGLALVTGRLTAENPRAAALLVERHEYPTPRVEFGRRARGLAHAAMDLSDGLVGDLPKLAAASGLAAQVDVGRLPLSRALRAVVPLAQAREWALAAGDDYELLVAVPPQRFDELAAVARRLHMTFTAIGELRPGAGVTWSLAGRSFAVPAHGYDHFR